MNSNKGQDKHALRFADPIGNWFRWFAWRPVGTSDHGVVWLLFVHRRRVQTKNYLDGPIDQWWQYVREL